MANNRGVTTLPPSQAKNAIFPSISMLLGWDLGEIVIIPFGDGEIP
jgi:hypothetical protein